MRYSDLSDFEINKLVAVKLGCRVVDDFQLDREQWWVKVDKDGERTKIFDYCGDASDALHIIVENEISLIPPVSNGTNGWKAERFYNENCGKLIDCIDKNPLRAAMIVFLMINEKSPD